MMRGVMSRRHHSAATAGGGRDGGAAGSSPNGLASYMYEAAERHSSCVRVLCAVTMCLFPRASLL